MKLEDIKPGVVVWNQWEYSIMGRDTGISSTYFIIVDAEEIHDDMDDRSIECTVMTMKGDHKFEEFKESEIKNGCLKLATKKEIRRLKAEETGELEKKITEHKSEIRILEVELDGIDDKYKEFIKWAL